MSRHGGAPNGAGAASGGPLRSIRQLRARLFRHGAASPGSTETNGPINAAGIRSYLRRSLIAGLVATALGLGTGLFAIASISASGDHIVHSLDPLQNDNAAVLRTLSNAESGIRGYELTGDRSFLTTFHSGVRSYESDISKALRVAAGDNDADGAIASVQAQASAWLAVAEPLSTKPVAPANAASAAGDLGNAFAGVTSAAQMTSSTIAAEITAAEGSADATETVGLVLVSTAGLLALLLAIFFWVAARRNVVRPLEDLVSSLSQLRSGDRRARLVPNGPAEVQAAGHAFNALAERLSVDARRRARIRALSDLITRDVREHVDISALLTEAVASIGIAFGVERVFVRLYEEDLLGPIAAEWHVGHLGNVSDHNETRPADLVAWLQQAAEARTSVVVEDVRTREPFQGSATLEYFERLNLVAMVICPIAAAGELVGTLTLTVGSSRQWQEEEVGLVEVAAGELARALQHATLFSAQRDLVASLQELDHSKSEFLSMVSHELRTPLTSITGYVEMLEDADAGPVNEQQMKMLHIVDRNARRLRGLIEDLLTLSRIEVGAFRVTLEPVDVSEVIDSALAIIEPTVRDKGLNMTTLFGADLGLILADRNHIERALLNLLANAAKFTPPSGTITVSATRDRAELVISVSDTGIGIPPDELDQLSTRFFRASNATERAIPGTGLGLTIVRNVVEHHGGVLEISSELGVGTTFVIHLPADRRRLPRSPATSMSLRQD